MTLYSKEGVTEAVRSMKKGNRMAHGFLLTGEKGVGKKVTALYIAKTLMCENCTDGVPCGECRNCRRIEKGTHPDVITPERSGKAMIYKVETIQEMYDDAYVMPNDCDAKVYILADCENIQERTQNIMLKLIEEPPCHAYFIFTAPDKSVFLPTILSRVITFGISECTEEECKKALFENGSFTEEQLNDALEAYHGNIGNCLEYLSEGEASETVKLCRSVIDGIIGGSEYEVNKALFGIGENRERVKRVLTMTDNVIRDVCMIRLCGADTEFIGCYKSGAMKLSEKLSFRKAEAMHEQIGKHIGYMSSNVNVAASMSALGGTLI